VEKDGWNMIRQMLNNNEELVTELSRKLVKELQLQIDEQTRKVEIQIS